MPSIQFQFAQILYLIELQQFMAFLEARRAIDKARSTL